MQKDVGNMSLYFCGGAGINIGKLFLDIGDGQQSKGFANMHLTYIDTSRSNISDDIKDEQVYLINGLDGSGKIRAENHKQISECVHDILMNHPPQDVSIIVSSNSGGSGNIISAALLKELLSRDKNVLVVGVSSSDSRIEIENSVKTMKSYEAISKMCEKPVVMMHNENTADSIRQTINSDIKEEVVQLAALFSRQNKELDSADLRNWLNYTRITELEPKLVFMGITHGKVEGMKSNIVSVATLAHEGHNTNLGTTVEYQCVGYIPSENETTIKLESAVHYMLLDGMIGDIYLKLSDNLAKMEESNLARKRTTVSLIGNNDKIDKSGLVF